MKKIILSIALLALIFSVNAQDSDTEKKEKTKGKDDSEVFVGEPDGEDYQVENRKETSKPLMPLYDVEQEFTSKKKKKKQQDAYMEQDYYFPAKPKNAWQIGIRGGISQVNGDVNQNFFKGNKPFVPGYTFGASVTKPFSYMFSLRLNYDFMEMWNTDWQPSTLTSNLINQRTALAAYVPGGDYAYFFHNTHTVAHDMTLDAVVSFGNVRFHKERTKVIFNAFVTGGGFMYQTWYDHFDADGNPYDYKSIPNISDPNVTKKDVIEALNNLRNGVYETAAEGHPETKDAELFGNYSFRPVFGAGFGMTFRLNRFMNLDFQTRMMFTRDDLVDGMRWEEPDGNSLEPVPGGMAPSSRSLTRDFDTYTNTTLGITFKLVGKKKTESTTLLNPMHYTYQKLAEADPEQAIEDLLKDDDGDGVPNRLDQEENTPEGAPVNPKGIAVDSDNDGIIDLDDEEPFSPPGLPVNDKGVAILPPPVEDKSGAACCSCDDINLPSVHFDKDKYYIKPEFYAHLHTVAEKMLACPDMKIKATGMTDKDDNAKYNEQLSWNRVNAVINYLSETYGIDKNRFLVSYEGESNASATSSSQQYQERKVSLSPAAPGESGDSNVAPPHPDIDAGSDK